MLRIPGSLHLIVMLLVLAMPKMALAITKDDFMNTYHAYLKAVDEKKWDDALGLSKESLEEGLQIFQKNGQNVANLRLNYARELNRAGRGDEAAKQLRLSLEANEEMHGPDSLELLGPLMDLGDTLAATNTDEAEKDYSRAIAIADKAHNDPLDAKLKFEAGLSLVKHNDFRDARIYLEDAHTYYLKQFGPTDGRSGIAALNLGNIYARDNRNKEARSVLISALQAFKGTDPISQQFDVGTRRLLVQVLEAMGHNEEATSHCLAIAMHNANGGSSNPELLYRNDQLAVAHIRTRDSQGKQVGNPNGEVDLTYTVDKGGRTVDVAVAASDDSRLNDTAIGFVKSFRYAPAIKDGKPVATTGVEFHYHARPSVPVKIER